MNTNQMHHCVISRHHQNPRCMCPECKAFDQSVTLPMQRVSAAPFIMTAIDTETSERVTYTYHQGVLHKMPAAPSSDRRHSKKKEGQTSFRTLLHDLVIETIEHSVQRHPFFWLCVSNLLR